MAGSGSKVDMKVVLLGKEYVGKTCLVQRYLHEKFSVDSPYQSSAYREPSNMAPEGKVNSVYPADLQLETMKVIILGKANIGKTSLTRRYVYNEFTARQGTTIGAAFGARRIIVNGNPIVMGIWDTAGSERYEAMSRIYYRGARAAVVCYDITEKSSFARLSFWVEELRKNEPDCKIYLCGTKKDLYDENPRVRQVDFHDASDYADDINAYLVETSSKTGENIDSLFMKIAEDYAEDIKRRPPTQGGAVSLGETTRQYKCRC